MNGYHKIPYELYDLPISLRGVVILSILTDMQGNKSECWIKYETIAKLLRCSKRSVMREIEILESQNLIKSIRVGNNKPNHYQVLRPSGRGVTSGGDKNDAPSGQNRQTEVTNCHFRSGHGVTSEPNPIEPTLLTNPTNQGTSVVFFDFLPEPGSRYEPGSTEYSALYLCLNISRDAGYDAEEQWKVGWKDWITMADRDISSQDNKNIDYFTAQVKQGYAAKNLAAIILKRILV